MLRIRFVGALTGSRAARRAGSDGPTVAAPRDALDAAEGAFLGACVGDAVGAFLEFQRRPTPAKVDEAMRLPGGGCFGVAPGQITDDSELALCLAQGLLDCPANGYSADAVAQWYRRWIASKPFDVGIATSNAFSHARDAQAMRLEARLCNFDSKANGSLMRASPLGVWGRRLPPLELARVARADSCLSHPNPSCQGAVAAYVAAVAHLVQRPGDRAGAFAVAEEVAATAGDEFWAEVRDWLALARANAGVPYQPQDGFVRIAFVHAFRHLRLGTPYAAALRETVAGGGDTDTNAAIVGGLVGAADGASNIAEALRRPVLECDTAAGRPRPDFLLARQVPTLVRRLFDAAPERLETFV